MQHGVTSDRATLGITIGANGGKRDTLGVFVVGVDDAGPAAKAGIEEGQRIASINGIDLRVDREDAGDAEVAAARVRRLQRALDSLKAGDAVELHVVGNGQSRTVKVTTVKASELPNGDRSMMLLEGGVGGGVAPLMIRRGVDARTRPVLPAQRRDWAVCRRIRSRTARCAPSRRRVVCANARGGVARCLRAHGATPLCLSRVTPRR